MPDDVSTTVPVPRWQITLLGGLVVVLVAAWIARGVANEKVIADLRDRVVRLETMHGMEDSNG